ncbi:membrane protein [Oceanobacillus oncorhynchi subsp. incaldanensis]|uniref:SLC13 family permease n=1 Tax=Oceanobacillus oncorhynchi TaxID=545501 RepID=UPI001B20421E|nr:SLC13 family permease [Oceanobacillus oncorhynchi]GIO19625.1 membrane protein [Oceanobacillus oncorhynchi subsp. incaldanensis]
MAGIALLSLVFVIVLGVITKKNIGIISLAVALVLGMLGGISSNDIIAGFPTSLFLNLFGMFFFFSIAKDNGSLELLSKKIFSALSGFAVVYPLMVFLVSGLITLVDPGGMTVYVILPVIVMSVGYQMGYNPILIGVLTIFGANTTLMTPVGVFGSTANLIVDGAGYPSYTTEIVLNGIILFTIVSALSYLGFRGWKRKQYTTGTLSLEESASSTILPPFNGRQRLTLVMLVLMILAIMFLGTHAGLTALVFSIILLITKAADEKDAFLGVPWDTIFLCIGIGNLLSVIDNLQGLKLLASMLGSVSTEWTLAPLLGITSSVMSFFSLAIAGPIPTLIPTIESLNASVGNTFMDIELISTVINGGFTAAISPLSMGGAMVLAAYGTLFKPSAKERTKVFNKLFFVAIMMSIIAGILANTGIYSIATGM